MSACNNKACNFRKPIKIQKNPVKLVLLHVRICIYYKKNPVCNAVKKRYSLQFIS